MKCKIIILFCLVLLFGCSVVETLPQFTVKGISMIPTLRDGEIVEYNPKFPFENLIRGDLVLLGDSMEYDADGEPQQVKRIVGLGGDVIELNDGKLYCNGVVVIEDYVTELCEIDFGPVTVADNEIFVLGDNRNVSVDSRSKGTYSISCYYGKVVDVVFK